MLTTQFIAVVEVATRLEQTRIDAATALADYDPVVGRSERGWVEVQLTITASGLAHACTTAAAMARVATGAEAIACQVMTKQEHDTRQYGVRLEALPTQRPARARETTGA